MDLLDRLLNLGAIDGYLDVRCEMRGDWVLENDQREQREIPYHVLLEGSATVEGRGLPMTILRSGDVLLLPSGLPHRILDRSPTLSDSGTNQAASEVRVLPNAGTTLLCGRIVLSLAAWRLYQSLLPASVVIRAEQCISNPAGSRLGRVLTLMREETEAPQPGGTAVLRHLSATLFGLALRAAVLDKAPPPGMLALSAHPRLGELALQIMEQPGRNWTIEEMAVVAKMSRSTLTRNFIALAGIAPADFVMRLRMAEASRRLRETAQSVAAVGEAVGYASEAAFQRAFKRETSFTPAAWRSMPQPAIVQEALHRVPVVDHASVN